MKIVFLDERQQKLIKSFEFTFQTFLWQNVLLQRLEIKFLRNIFVKSGVGIATQITLSIIQGNFFFRNLDD